MLFLVLFLRRGTTSVELLSQKAPVRLRTAHAPNARQPPAENQAEQQFETFVQPFNLASLPVYSPHFHSKLRAARSDGSGLCAAESGQVHVCRLAISSRLS